MGKPPPTPEALSAHFARVSPKLGYLKKNRRAAHQGWANKRRTHNSSRAGVPLPVRGSLLKGGAASPVSGELASWRPWVFTEGRPGQIFFVKIETGITHFPLSLFTLFLGFPLGLRLSQAWRRTGFNPALAVAGWDKQLTHLCTKSGYKTNQLHVTDPINLHSTPYNQLVLCPEKSTACG